MLKEISRPPPLVMSPPSVPRNCHTEAKTPTPVGLSWGPGTVTYGPCPCSLSIVELCVRLVGLLKPSLWGVGSSLPWLQSCPEASPWLVEVHQRRWGPQKSSRGCKIPSWSLGREDAKCNLSGCSSYELHFLYKAHTTTWMSCCIQCPRMVFHSREAVKLTFPPRRCLAHGPCRQGPCWGPPACASSWEARSVSLFLGNPACSAEGRGWVGATCNRAERCFHFSWHRIGQ
jgi:hypothetical protein